MKFGCYVFGNWENSVGIIDFDGIFKICCCIVVVIFVVVIFIGFVVIG